MTREPDRFDKQAQELVALLGNDARATTLAGYIAAALRAEAERAAQIVEEKCYNHGPRPVPWCQYCLLAGKIRALASPAAAPAVEPEPYVHALGEALLRKELEPQPDPLRRLTPEELAKARGISRERFEAALAQGHRDRDAMQVEHDKQRLPGTFKAPPSEPAAPAPDPGGHTDVCATYVTSLRSGLEREIARRNSDIDEVRTSLIDAYKNREWGIIRAVLAKLAARAATKGERT